MTPTITLTPTSGSPGIEVRIDGSAFHQDVSYRFWWGKKFIASGITDASGSFWLGWQAGNKKGPVTVKIMDALGDTATAIFTVV